MPLPCEAASWWKTFWPGALDHYRIGDLIRINEVEGRIEEILSTAIVLKSDEGIITVPASRFVSSEVLRIIETKPGADNAGES